ncbi:unannotated protein [freshwater metagenome]|uniref:Unannotated protein n=1 Tax=freshwater metagenome TaxID=449393 RepID=A0A6J6IC92_9ZZZZ
MTWVLTIFLMSIFAGLSWAEVDLTLAAGGQNLEVSGFQAFPVASALILLQAVALLTNLFTPELFGRLIAALLIPIQLWHLIAVSSSGAMAVQIAVETKVAEITGVVGSAGQIEFIQSTITTSMWGVYIFALAINLLVLVARSSLKASPRVRNPSAPEDQDSGDLWESQR